MTPDSATRCRICQAPASFLRTVDEVAFFRCNGCGSLHAHPDFLDAMDRAAMDRAAADRAAADHPSAEHPPSGNYGDAYWATELASARQRAYGGSVVRVAETLRMARIPVRRFLDIGSGPGFLLDALAELLPNLAGMFHGVELLPPPVADRSRHANYRLGTVGDLDGHFEAGVCIEVIEHLTPQMLSALLRALAARSTPGALYYFNSAQPSFVEGTDPGYLDPRVRGHIVSWSIAGARAIFAPAGFNVIAIPGRDWAFFAEFGPLRAVSVDDLMSWLWQPVPENMALFHHDAFGPLFETIGVEATRCYLEAALADGRGHWALELERQLRLAAHRGPVRSIASVLAWLRRLRNRRSG
jgi:SAM-dependent methyltransferase